MIAMEAMKSSRRKQTKPIRVPFGVDPDTGALDATISSQPLLPLISSPARTSDEEPRHNGGQESLMEDADVPLDMHVSIIACKMCPETFPCSEDLREHIDLKHGGVVKRPRLDMSDFPTAYHRLGSELFQENAFLPNGHPEPQTEVLSLTKPKANVEPKEQSIKEQNGDSSRKVDGGKIFHPDAYCELCDREFCNKYFLKTHKANKHGIFDRTSPTPFSSSASTPPSGVPLPQDAPAPFEVNLPASPPHKAELSTPPWQQPPQQPPAPKKEAVSRPDHQLPSPNAKKSEAEAAAEKKVTSLISAVMNSMPGGHSSASDSSRAPSGPGSGSSSSSNSNSSSGKDPSMEDYCEICQKHFCNKYYLKKHKQDVHGIIPETGPTTTKRSRASASLLDLPVPSSVGMGSPMLLPQPMVSIGGMPAIPPGVMVLNPFLQQMTIIPTGNLPQPLLHGHQLHPPPQSPSIPQPLPLPGTLPGPSPTPPTSSSSSQMQSQSSPLGVLNPDAYCSLCRKEFCNKYFLKIHNANKHGMSFDDLPPEAHLLGDMVENRGFVVSGPPPSPKDSKHDQYQASSRSNPPPLTSINQMVTCRLCDKDFPNAHAYKLHQISEHGKGLEASLPDVHENSLPKPDSPMERHSHDPFLHAAVDASAAAQAAAVHAAAAAGMVSGPGSSGGSGTGGSGGTTMFGSMVAAKLADRVTCDICNKELCNKYFLKNHKLKMHGVDVEAGSDKPPSAGGRKTPQQASPTSKHQQPLNMTMAAKPPMGLMPKLELRDFPDYGKDYRDFKMMKEFGAFKNFPDMPSYLADTLGGDFFRRSQPPFKGLDFSHPGLPQGPVDCPAAEELVKMGIDPEAYCEICKKEFCSKYFLRTHRSNIHGIKTEIAETDRSRSRPSSSSLKQPNGNKLNSSSSNNNNSINNNNNHSHHGTLNMHPFPMPGLSLGFGLERSLSAGGYPGVNGGPGFGSSGGVGGGGGGGGGSRLKDGFEKHTWRWKEPVNSARVTCDICNKEVCNKYFLRTHKQNKHGITPSDKSLSPTMSGSPVPSDVDASSNTSSQPDNFLLDRATGVGARIDIQGLPPSERSPKNPEQPRSRSEDERALSMTTSRNGSHGTTATNNSSGSNGFPTCHLCDRQFKNTQWLTAHLMKDHSELCDSEAVDMRVFPPAGRSPQVSVGGDPKVCQVCHLLFPSELNLQLHLIQEHNAHVMLQDDDISNGTNLQGREDRKHTKPLLEKGYPSGVGLRLRNFGYRRRPVLTPRKLKMYVCSLCEYQTSWHCNLVSHEKEAHGVLTDRGGRYGCGPREEEPEAGYFNSLEERFSGRPGGCGVSTYRCGLCTARFNTHGFCRVHLQDVHIHLLKDFVARKQVKAWKKLRCSLCPFATRYYRRLRSHVILHHHHQQQHNNNNNNNNNRVALPNSWSFSDDPYGMVSGAGSRRDEHKREADSLFLSSLSKVEVTAGVPRETFAPEDGLMQKAFQLDVHRSSSSSSRDVTTASSSSPGSTSNFVTAVTSLPVRQKVHDAMPVSFLLAPITP